MVAVIREDLGPSEIARRMRVWSKARPRLAMATAAGVACLVTVAVVGVLTAPATAPLPTSKQALSGKLRTAAGWAAQARVGEVMPTSEALASRLHVHDPGTRYVALPAPGAATADPQTIGVYTARGRTLLRAETPTAEVITLVDKGNGPRLRTEGGIAPVNRRLLTNGGFERGRADWQILPGDVARATVGGPGHQSREAARIEGSGAEGKALVFEQSLPYSAPRGACFSFSAWVRVRELSRPLLVWAGLLHSDGTASPQLVLGDRHAGVGPGSTRWRHYETSGKLREPIRSVTVFAADTGEVPITGSALIDDVSFRRTC